MIFRQHGNLPAKGVVEGDAFDRTAAGDVYPVDKGIRVYRPVIAGGDCLVPVGRAFSCVHAQDRETGLTIQITRTGGYHFVRPLELHALDVIMFRRNIHNQFAVRAERCIPPPVAPETSERIRIISTDIIYLLHTADYDRTIRQQRRVAEGI